MSEWKEYKISELVSLNIIAKPLDGNHGGIHPTTKDYVSKGIPFVMASDINNGNLDLTTCKFLTFEHSSKLKKGFAKEGDVLLTHKASIGRTAIVPKLNVEYIVLTPQVTYYRVLDETRLNNFYLMYYFNSLEFQNLLITFSGSGSTRAYIGITEQLNLSIKLPPIILQKQIAEILSSLDDKIKINNKINQELEALAKTLFNQWFIDFEFPNENGEPYKSSGGEMVENELGEIPKGWEVTKVSTLDYKLQTGTRPKGGVGGITSGVPSIGAESVKGLGYYDFSKIKYVSNEFASKMKRGKVDGYELLIYKDGGKPGTFIPHFSMFGEGFPFETFFINEHVFLLDFFDKAFNSFCYFYFDSEYVKPVFENNGGKAAIPGINQEDVKNLLIFRPDNEMVKVFGEFAKSSITTILKNCKENIQLINLREELLPKLISGELEINEINN